MKDISSFFNLTQTSWSTLYYSILFIVKSSFDYFLAWLLWNLNLSKLSFYFSEFIHFVKWLLNTYHAPRNVLCSFGRVQLFATPWTVASQDPLSMEVSMQEHWSRLLFPLSGDLPDPGMEPTSLVSLALAKEFFTTASPGKQAIAVNKKDFSRR